MANSNALFSRTKWTALLLLAVALFVLDVGTGTSYIAPSNIWQALLEAEPSVPIHHIVQKIRLPRAITAILAGMALAVAGLQLQALFRNPLAGPSVLGITAGSSLGVAAVVLWLGQGSAMRLASQWGIGGHWLMVAASSAGAMAMLALIMAVAHKVPDNASLLVVGMMAGNLSLAVVGIWQYFSAPEQVKEFLFWTFGSLEGIWGQQLWALALAVLAGLVLALFSGKSLNLLLLGDEYAQSMGLPVRRTKLLIIASGSLLAGAVTAFCGPIGFVGIAVPHLARQLFRTADHRVLLPGCMLIGAALLLVCDIFSHLPGTQLALPINAATALIGSPIVIWVLVSSGRR